MTLAVLITTGSDMLVTVDVSDPTNPVQLGALSTSDMSLLFGGVELRDNIAYFGSYGADALLTVDVSNPESPKQVGKVSSVELDGANHNDLATNTAYVTTRQADNGDRLLVSVDITDPTAMTQLDSIFHENFITLNQVRIENDVAFFVDADGHPDNGAIHSVDVSDPANMGYLDTLSDATILDSAHALLIDSGKAYVTVGSAGVGNNSAITVIDISDPSNLTHVSTLELTTGSSDNGEGIDKVGDTVFTTVGSLERLYAVDAADPSNMSVIGEIEISGTADPWGVKVSDGYAYVADRNDDALVIIDVSDPTSMSVVGRVSTPELDGARYLALGPLSLTTPPLRFEQRDDSEFANNPNDPRITTGGQAPTTRQNSIRHSGQTYW